MWNIKKLGKVDYEKAYELQSELVAEEGKHFLLCEHPPVFTRGKGSKETNILDKNIPVVMTNRGGDLTYHEEGQLVGYIILDLKKEKLSVKQYLNKIENLIINTLARVDINAREHSDLVGVWVGDKKIASIGIGIKKGVTMHGFALNINNDMGGFSRINPCGLSYDIMTSVKTIKDQEISMDLIQDLMIEEFHKIF
jgi:lipoyl(octanoyl) transferase